MASTGAAADHCAELAVTSAATIECRLLGSDDLALLDNPADGVFDVPVDTDRAAEFLADPRHHLAGAFDGERLVGMASAVHYVHPDKPPQMWINEVGVSPDFRQCGLATRLLQLLIDKARQLRCNELWVLTDSENEAANRLYQGVGAVPAERTQVMYTVKLS